MVKVWCLEAGVITYDAAHRALGPFAGHGVYLADHLVRPDQRRICCGNCACDYCDARVSAIDQRSHGICSCKANDILSEISSSGEAPSEYSALPWRWRVGKTLGTALGYLSGVINDEVIARYWQVVASAQHDRCEIDMRLELSTCQK